MAAIDAAAGVALGDLVDRLVLGPFDPDLDRALELFGLQLVRAADESPVLGVRFETNRTVIAAVPDDSPAFRAGLSPADEVLAVDRFRVNADDFDRVWESVAEIGKPLRVLVARLGVLRELTVTPERSLSGKVRITSVAEPSSAQLAHRTSWLGVDTIGSD